MKAQLQLQKPDDMEATIVVTMPLKEWKLVRAALADDPRHEEPGRRQWSYVVDRFAALIGRALDDANKVFTSTLTVTTEGGDTNVLRKEGDAP